MQMVQRSLPSRHLAGDAGCWLPPLPDLAALRTWLLVWLLLALPLALLLASATAAGQAAPQPAPSDPCQMAPNLPYCP
jgi:hypothetical protein